MRICHVVYECVPGSFAGGVQKMVLELAHAQAERGDEVEIWTIGEFAGRNLAPRLELKYFPGRVRFGSAALRRTLVREHARFDVVHSHNTFLPLNIAVASIAGSSTRVFFHAHGALDPQLLAGWNFKALKKRVYVAALERRNYDRATGVLGLTRGECAQIKAIGTTAPLYELPNGIQIQPPASGFAAAEFRLRNRIAPDQPVVLFIGRIVRKKGVHYLLDAMALIRQQLPEAVLVICGGRDQDRDYIRELDAQVARHALEPSVRWAGFVDEQAKRSAFACAQVFAHPSYSEGMAIAILEAMSFGLPTVVTPGCYMDTAVAAGAVHLSQQNGAELARAIVDLLSQPGLRSELGLAARQHVLSHHTWPAIAERLDCIYRGVAEVDWRYIS